MFKIRKDNLVDIRGNEVLLICLYFLRELKMDKIKLLDIENICKFLEIFYKSLY